MVGEETKISLIKDLRFSVLIILVIASAYLLASPYILKSSGVTVSFVSDASKCSGLKDGNIITQVESRLVNTEDEFKDAIKNFVKGNSVSIVANGNPINCLVINDGDIGITVRKIEGSALKFGIDIEGGTRVLLKPKTNATLSSIEETINTLNNRINFYGLSEIHVAPVGENLIQIEMAGASGDEVRNFLAKQGKFEGKLSEIIRIVNGTGKFIVGGNSYPISVVDSQININGSVYSENQSFVIESMKVDVGNITERSVNLLVNIFTGEDITAVFTDAQSSRVVQVESGYEFAFSIQTSKVSAERFAKATKGQPLQIISGTERYIEPKLVLLLDGKPVSELNIAANLAGQALTTASIQGFEKTRQDAIREKTRLESTLRSGSLPVELEIVKVDTITQTAGKDLINSTFYVAIAAAIAVSVIIFIRYRDFKIAFPMIAISFCEILLILGVAASQIFAGIIIVLALVIAVLKKEVFGMIGWVTVFVMIAATVPVVISTWTLDIAAIAGLIAILGTGVNQMIIMTDQLLLEKDKSLRERHKIAMSLIWSSAAMVAFAMIPLMVLGVGTLKGFAITTIVGVFIGILITRPAYMAILERVKKLDQVV